MARIWIIGLSLNILLACAVYYTKYEVVDLEGRYFALQRKYVGLQELQHTLSAEHTLLTSPKRLTQLALKAFGSNYANPEYHQFTTELMLANALAPFDAKEPLDFPTETGSLRLASNISYFN